MFSYISGSVVLSSSSICEGGFSYLSILDVDCAYDPQRVVMFQRALHDIFNINSYSNRSLGGRAHIYIPFTDRVLFSKMHAFSDIMAKLAENYFNCKVEFVPSSPGKQICIFSDSIDYYGYGGVVNYNFYHKNEKVSFKKKLNFFTQKFFRYANNESTLDNVLKRIPLMQHSVQYLSRINLSIDNESYEKLELIPVTEEQRENFLLEIANDLKKYYYKGNRNNIIYSFSGLAAAMKVSFSKFLDIVKILISEDEEFKSRVNVISRTFSRIKKGEKISFSSLYEYLPEYSFKFLFVTNENYQKAIQIISSIKKEEIDASKKSIETILSDIVYKSVIFGKRFVMGYNALSKRGISKRDISKVFKYLKSKNVLVLIAKGRWINYGEEKISLGTVFELSDLKSYFRYSLPKDFTNILKDSLSIFVDIFKLKIDRIENLNDCGIDTYSIREGFKNFIYTN
jgi:hypothetical protein